jgi:hypothetical protein
MSPRDDETVRLVVPREGWSPVDDEAPVGQHLSGAEREQWADEWLKRQAGKLAWERDMIPAGLTREDIASAVIRQVNREHPETVAEIRCDCNGRVDCPFCGGPLRLTEWKAVTQLVREADGTLSLLNGTLIFCGGFAACIMLMFCLHLAGVVKLGGAQ